MNLSPAAGGHGPRPVKESLNRLLGSLGSPSADVLATLFEHWPDAAGAALATLARPARLVNRRLIVEVDDPACAAQLRLREGELLDRLSECLGPGKVQSIRPRVAVAKGRGGPFRR